jgi:hypothetical protein
MKLTTSWEEDLKSDVSTHVGDQHTCKGAQSLPTIVSRTRQGPQSARGR